MTAPIDTDDGLRAALDSIVSQPDEPHDKLWEEIGKCLLIRAHHGERLRGRHIDEYISAYLVAAIEVLKLRPDGIVRADRPWALLVSVAKRAAMRAVAVNDSAGLTARDPITHKRRAIDSRVVSLDGLRDRSGFDFEYEDAV